MNTREEQIIKLSEAVINMDEPEVINFILNALLVAAQQKREDGKGSTEEQLAAIRILDVIYGAIELDEDEPVPPEDWTADELYSYLIGHCIISPEDNFEDWMHDRTDMIKLVQRHLDNPEPDNADYLSDYKTPEQYEQANRPPDTDPLAEDDESHYETLAEYQLDNAQPETKPYPTARDRKYYQKVITKMQNANKLIFEIEMAMAGTTAGAMKGIRYLHSDISSLATGIKIKADHINDIINAKE